MPTENKSNRRLAAILFADIVGYTAMMQTDEIKGRKTLEKFRNTLNQKVTEHNGQIINDLGDGCLCTFESAVDAMHCAKEAQLSFLSTPKISVRIGLHSGDVFYEANNVYGDSVNIASRIESLGVAGSVLLSNRIRQHIENQPDFKINSLGEYDFKNVNKSMEVFALANEGLVVPRKDEMKGKIKSNPKEKSALEKWWPLVAFLFIASAVYYFISQSEKSISSDVNEKSIAVLPFTDLSPKKDQEYFSIGMMDEILNHLVKIEDLQVSSRTSSMQYLDTTIPISEISQSLGAANVLEGSVRKAGDQIRITVQLINGLTDKHLWSETYDREFEDIFSIQSDVAQQIALTLKAEIYNEVKERIESVPTRNMDAYDLWLRTYDLYPSDEKADLLHEVLEIDPNFASAYALLANVWLNRGGFAGEYSREEIIPEANKYLNKAFELDPHNAMAHKNMAQLTLWYEWDFEKAEKEWNTYVRLYPSSLNPNIIDFYSSVGKFDEAKKWAERIYSAYKKEGGGWTRRGLPYALSGDFEKSNEYYSYVAKNHSFWYAQCEAARGFLYSKEYEKAIEIINKAFEDNENVRYPRNLSVLSMAYFNTNQNQKAHILLDELARIM